MSRLTIVLSQSPGKHPAKRSLEESIVAALLAEPGLEVSVVPNLYDLGPDHTGRLFLESVGGDMVVLAWMFPRAVHWLLDRVGVKGHLGESKLKPPKDEDEEEFLRECYIEPEPSASSMAYAKEMLVRRLEADERIASQRRVGTRLVLNRAARPSGAISDDLEAAARPGAVQQDPDSRTARTRSGASP